MSRYVVDIRLGNDAFEPSEGAEVGRILRVLGENVEAYGIQTPHKLMDFNGNCVGEAAIVGTRKRRAK